MSERGHLFVIKGDMLQLDCDALLLPTGPEFAFHSAWSGFLGIEPWHVFDPDKPWADGEVVRRIDARPTDSRGIYATCVAVGYGSLVGIEEAIAVATEAAVEFVRVAAREASSAAHRSGQPARLAVPMVGTGASGLGGVAGELVLPLVEGLTSAAAECGVDVVLCTIRESDWSAVQSLRAASPPTEIWDLPDGLMQRSADLANHARDENLVLFMGAGVGQDAGLPDWNTLLQVLGEAAGFSASEMEAMQHLDPRDRARLIERRATDEVDQFDMRRLIGEQLTVDCFGLSHALLASLEVQAAVTTNYDSLYERAAVVPKSDRPMPRRLPYEPITSTTSWVLKLHGDLEEGDVVITRSDYLGLARHRSALFGVVQALLLTKHLLFIGYSMNDDDFHSLVDEIESALGPESAHRLGTALVLERSITSELWDDIVDIEIMDAGSGSSPERTLLLVLDRAACLATDYSAHLLDPNFAGLFTDEEQHVAAMLAHVVDLAQELPQESVARSALEALRAKLGGG